MAFSLHIKKFLAVIILMALVFLCSNPSLAQEPSLSDDYKDLVHETTLKKVKNYADLETHFFKYKRDSLKMRYLLNQSIKDEYPEGQSYAMNELGIVFRNISSYEKAIEKHLEAFDIATKINNKELQVISLNMLGVVYRRQDNVRAALDYHTKALEIAENTEKPSIELTKSIAVSQNSMGNIYLALQQFDMAINHFKRSLKIETETNNSLGLAINYQNIGYALEEKGLIDSALVNYNKSLKYNNLIDSDIGRVICYNSIASIEIKKGDYEKSLPLVEEALEKALKISDQYYISESYLNLGLTHLKLKNYQEAENNLTKGLSICKEFNFKYFESEAYNYLSELNEKQGKYQTSLDFHKKYVELDKTITNRKNIQYVNDLILEYETEKKNNQIRALADENEIVKLKLKQNKQIALLSLLGGMLIIGILFVLYRQRQLKNEKRIFSLEQEMLRNQMNPHFIFNSLNSIKLYIVNNEKENAVYYLNKFSKLMRRILIASTEKEISLQDELDTMQLYMNIENMRFSNEIEYQVEIEKGVNPLLIRVPSLLLQPFLENALWHGLSNKEGRKHIQIDVKKKSYDHITITITDNGIGRQASQKIKSQKKLKRKSVGIDLTKARLENFSKSYTSDYQLTIEDLYKNEKPQGTKVTIDIPIKSVVLKTA